MSSAVSASIAFFVPSANVTMVPAATQLVDPDVAVNVTVVSAVTVFALLEPEDQLLPAYVALLKLSPLVK